MATNATEPVLEPDLPIVDPHHHLWDRSGALAELRASPDPFARVLEAAPTYLMDELAADAGSGHRVLGTVYVQCGAFYREGGPPEMQPVGEVETVAAMADAYAAESGAGGSGAFRPCAGIVGHADLLLGDRAAEVLEAEVEAGRGRLKGIRHSSSHDPDPAVFGMLNRAPPDLLARDAFRAGFARLAPLGLTFDAWLGEPQLPALLDLARAFPDTGVVLDHVGTPLGLGSYAERQAERFPVWRAAIRELAACPNVSVKLGGLGMPFPALVPLDRSAGSERLADAWRPYVDACVEAFGAERCMFESNFPVDGLACDYAALWNAFKRCAAGASADEKRDLFGGTAVRVYRLEVLRPFFGPS